MFRGEKHWGREIWENLQWNPPLNGWDALDSADTQSHIPTHTHAHTHGCLTYRTRRRNGNNLRRSHSVVFYSDSKSDGLSPSTMCQQEVWDRPVDRWTAIRAQGVEDSGTVNIKKEADSRDLKCTICLRNVRRTSRISHLEARETKPKSNDWSEYHLLKTTVSYALSLTSAI